MVNTSNGWLEKDINTGSRRAAGQIKSISSNLSNSGGEDPTGNPPPVYVIACLDLPRAIAGLG